MGYNDLSECTLTQDERVAEKDRIVARLTGIQDELTPKEKGFVREWAKKVAADLEPPARTVREQGEWEKVERVTAEACFKAKGETRYWDYEVVDAEDYDRAVAYIRELERQREVKWNAWLKANQDLARLNTVLADALRIATESCMIFLFNPRPTVQAQVEHFMQQAESKLAASPQEKK